jgi:hypothetical protein
MMEGALITGCQYIGPEQKMYPYTMCGCKPFPGRVYCEDHIWLVYNKGSGKGNKRKIKEIEKELAEIKRIEEVEEIINA